MPETLTNGDRVALTLESAADRHEPRIPLILGTFRSVDRGYFEIEWDGMGVHHTLPWRVMPVDETVAKILMAQ